MKRLAHIRVISACAALIASVPLLAADAMPWPWKDMTPPDLALASLYQIDSVSVSIDDEIVSISVEATAPTPGFTELQLVPRMGDPDDRIFAFDAKGRPPQDMTIQVLTPVTIEAAYTDAPIVKLGVIEVFAQSNCKAFSVTDGKEAECTSKPIPQ